MSDCSEPLRLVPGPTGSKGADGTNGVNGLDSFTTLNGNFTMPNVGLTNVASVVKSGWAVIGQSVYLQGAGTLIVTAVTDATHITLQNPSGYAGNIAGGTVIATGNKLGPSGLIGPAGAAGAGQTLNSVSPTTNKGDLIVDNGALSPAANDVRLAVGTNGKMLHADSTQATGLRWDQVDLSSASEVKNVLPAANGGNSNRVLKTGDIMTGQLTISYAAPTFEIEDTAGAANEKRWESIYAGGSLNFYITDDVGSVSNSWLIVNRAGATPTLVDFQVNTRIQGSFKVLHFFDDIQDINGTLVNGNNNNFGGFISSYTKIKNGPTGAFVITGIANGSDGRTLLLQNATGQNMTLSHEDVLSTASNRLTSMSGASITMTTDGFAELIYDVDSQRWIIKYVTQ